MLKPQQLPWVHPLELAASIYQPQFVLLYSGTKTSYSGRYSFLAVGLRDEIKADGFEGFGKVLSHDREKFENAWFGYLGYGLKNQIEKLRRDEESWLKLPDLWMMRFDSIYVFDHEEETLTLWSDGLYTHLTASADTREDTIPEVAKISSNMSEQEYLQKAAIVIENIQAGEIYQANLTRKFYGEFAEEVDGFSLFRKLCAVSPAPFSAFIKLSDISIISSSPESFLNIDKEGMVKTSPIKGTAPRGKDKKADQNLRERLAESEKDRAENLMIVDLMRNDLARTCELGSVRVEKLFELTSHATIHHLSSTITGNKLPELPTLDVVKAAFPAGSMTGAPKIRAMELCSKLEGDERGVYSGSIGWFGGDGSCELSVVIRTLILQGKKFEFQVGGGIVADSTPEKELAETISKARGILLALGLSEGALGKVD